MFAGVRNIPNALPAVKINVAHRKTMRYIYGMSKDKHFGLRLDGDEHKKLIAAAEEDGRSVSNLVRKIITEWLAARSTKKGK